MHTYRTVAEYFTSIFGRKVQKIAVNAGLGCPNRDGTAGFGGCIFCNNAAFNPSYAFDSAGSITEQLESGIRFFSGKGGRGAYLAYFQSYSNTYAPTDRLIPIYEEALSFPGVLGLVIATRPDCLEEDLLDYFEHRFGRKAPEGHPYLLVELGVESTEDETLRKINRGHDYACAAKAVRELDNRGIAVGVHIILGLPGEDMGDFANHARRISALPVTTVKLHQLQVIKGTKLAEMYAAGDERLHLFTPEEYAGAVRVFLDNLRADIAVDRLVSEAPKDMVIAPSWGLKPSEFAKYFLSLSYETDICRLCGGAPSTEDVAD